MKKAFMYTKALAILLGVHGAMAQASPINWMAGKGVRVQRKPRWDKPHQGAKDCARRRLQLLRGQIYNRYDFTAKVKEAA